MKRSLKEELNLIFSIVEEEATDCFVMYDTEYNYCHYDREIQTVYIREHLNSENSVEFHMLKNLVERVKEINPRYHVGIIYQDRTPLAEELNDIRQSYSRSLDEGS